MKNRRLVVAVVAAVLVIWLVGAAVTKYSLEQMAFFAPIAVCVIGATAAVVMLWVKVVAAAPPRASRCACCAKRDSAGAESRRLIPAFGGADP